MLLILMPDTIAIIILPKLRDLSDIDYKLRGTYHHRPYQIDLLFLGRAPPTLISKILC